MCVCVCVCVGGWMLQVWAHLAEPPVCLGCASRGWAWRPVPAGGSTSDPQVWSPGKERPEQAFHPQPELSPRHCGVQASQSQDNSLSVYIETHRSPPRLWQSLRHPEVHPSTVYSADKIVACTYHPPRSPWVLECSGEASRGISSLPSCHPAVK